MYSASASVVTNGKWSNMRAVLSKMEMHVDTILMFMWMRQYAASISVFPIMMILDGYLISMDAIMWGNTRKQNP